MDVLTEWWNKAMDYLQAGFGELNWTLPLLMAIWFALQVGNYKSVPKSALGATAMLLVLSVLPLRRGEQFKLPDNLLTQDYLLGLVATFMAFMLLIALFFTTKRTVLKGGGH